MVVTKSPSKVGNQAVTAVAAPRATRETIPKICSRMKMMIAITPTARNPGISRMEWSQPISAPVKPAASITKLFKSADHVAKDSGMAIAISTKSTQGCCHLGKPDASLNGTILAKFRCCMSLLYAFDSGFRSAIAWISSLKTPAQIGLHPTPTPRSE